ncbi:MAG: PorP/SprF family type IX secretion system membrane protein [Flavobacterium sp.]|uniref:PorP/SprF family type IX secretion system membrane protein n=1 Tax=Flavobacterium sp. TaxID=239 RepID=UPI0026016B2A|nr:PorP/SprF family type IX secretion system membrane protein [Flavobacterium sp.]MDD5148924.1 PorP/SprF family type IX secretion system membrane protein [Flavobacterium sp.]
MNRNFIVILFFFCAVQMLYSQEDGVVAFALPVRNSLKFNKFIINPTFSFVKEQSPMLSFYNKRQWAQFDNAPQTFLFSYSGRFRESEGVALGLFQQNYGVLTTFGAVANFAHNITFQEDSNLTFGMNLGIYKSGLNKGKVITNYPDPSLDNIPSNSLITVSPGINYGTTFLDFGVSVNNLILYNLKTSKIIEDDSEKSIEGHIMYNGYIDSYGFFDRSKFSGLIKTEIKKDKTIISGLAMLTLLKGLWVQAGYNTLYGMSGGIGMNITPKISMEYNFEKGTGNLSNFGVSHEIVFAYKFSSKKYDYGDDEDEGSIISATENRVKVTPLKEISHQEYQKYKEQKEAQLKSEAEAKLLAAAKAKVDAEIASKAKLDEAARLKAEADAKAKQLAESKLKANSGIASKAKLAETARLKSEAYLKSKQLAEAKLKADAAAKAKLAEESRLKSEADAKFKQLAEAKLKADAAAKAKLAEESRLKSEADANSKQLAEAKLKADAAAKAKLAEESRLKSEADAKSKQLAEAKLKADAAAKAKLAEEARLKAEADAEAKQLAEKPKDENAKSIDDLTKIVTDSKKEQQDLIRQLNDKVSDKEKDLKDLKEENDLSEKGIFKEPKPFKSVTAENIALESLESQIELMNQSQKEKIVALDNLYKERIKNGGNINDVTNQSYLKTIQDLKAEHVKAIKSNLDLVSTLEKIKVDTEIEKKRRIKRAAFANNQDRYLQDVATLKRIKEKTVVSTIPLKESDFDFGEEQSNVQVLKDIKNTEKGYYLVVAVHDDIVKRDSFLTKTVASGQPNVDFFYDVKSGKYFIYCDKYESIEEAQKGMESKGNRPYNSKMSVVKIEN